MSLKSVAENAWTLHSSQVLYKFTPLDMHTLVPSSVREGTLGHI